MSLMTASPVTTKGFFLDGKWIEAGDLIEIRSPYDQSIVGEVYQGRREHAEAAIAAAVKAFGTTRRLPAFERQRVLRQVAATITARKEEFARTMALESGKPLKVSRTEVERGIFTFNVAAEESTRIYGEYLPLDWQQFTAGRWGIVKRFPLGPVAGITPFNFPLNLVAHKVAPAIAAGGPLVLKPAPQTPLTSLLLAEAVQQAGWPDGGLDIVAFNFPLNLVAHKVAPAIAAGCPLVLKPAPQTPLTSLLLAEAVQQAGWPDGGLNILPLSNEDAGLLVTDDRIKLISFTGSVPVGWDIKRRAGKKKVVLELGGNAAVIVHSDADLDYAAERCVTGGFGYAGQTCISVQRILVEHSVYGRFTDLFVERSEERRVGKECRSRWSPYH